MIINSNKIKMDFPSIQTKYLESEMKIMFETLPNLKCLTMGPKLQEFETNFATYLNCNYAFGLNNCTAALEIAAILSEVKEGDEVILPAHTFTATAIPFLRKKAKLVFADLDPQTLVMDVNDIAKKINNKTKVIVPVHLYGVPVQMPDLLKITENRNIFIIEDCAQAPGAEIAGKKVGTWGDVGCFSFHGQKNITTLGEGGMIVTNNPNHVEKILGIRKIGQRPFKTQSKYWLPAMTNIVESVPGEIPFNFALSEMAALAGMLQLKRLSEINKSRETSYERIKKGLLKFNEIKFQNIPENATSAYHLLPIIFTGINQFSRDHLIEDLMNDYGIKCVIQYCPLYRYELFINNGYCSRNAECPNADYTYDHMISLPFWSYMKNEDCDYLIESIINVLNKYKGP